MLYPTALLADALADRLVAGYCGMFGAREPQWADLVAVASGWRCELIGDSDALYHDAQHTALVTLVGQDILCGRLLVRPLEPSDWAHLTLALLLHDIGYVRGVCPATARRCVVDAWATPSPCRAAPATLTSPPGMSSAASSRCARASATIRRSTPSASSKRSSEPASRCRR